VLLALIDRDKSVFAIEPEELPALKRAGVSQAVLLAMLKSGRQPPAVTPEGIEPLRMIGPDITVVGHGPEIPNAAPESYAMFAPPVWSGGLAVIGPRPCALAAATSNRYIQIGPPTVGRYVPDPASRFENTAAVAAAAPRSGAATVNCHSMAAPRRQHSRR
jgi:hypothetical protein